MADDSRHRHISSMRCLPANRSGRSAGLLQSLSKTFRMWSCSLCCSDSRRAVALRQEGLRTRHDDRRLAAARQGACAYRYAAAPEGFTLARGQYDRLGQLFVQIPERRRHDAPAGADGQIVSRAGDGCAARLENISQARRKYGTSMPGSAGIVGPSASASPVWQAHFSVSGQRIAAKSVSTAQTSLRGTVPNLVLMLATCRRTLNFLTARFLRTFAASAMSIPTKWSRQRKQRASMI